MDLLSELFTGDGPSTLTLAIIGIVCLAAYELARRHLPGLSISR